MSNFVAEPLEFHWAPLWLPFNWRNEVSGRLPTAIKAYLDNRVEKTPMEQGQVTSVRDYLIHYIHAPCWTENLDPDDADGSRILSELRFEAMHLASPEAIGAWIRKAMDIGLDPL